MSETVVCRRHRLTPPPRVRRLMPPPFTHRPYSLSLEDTVIAGCVGVFDNDSGVSASSARPFSWYRHRTHTDHSNPLLYIASTIQTHCHVKRQLVVCRRHRLTPPPRVRRPFSWFRHRPFSWFRHRTHTDHPNPLLYSSTEANARCVTGQSHLRCFSSL